MNKEPFTIERTYNASVSKVWSAITNKEQMKQWYFDLAEFRPEVGFEFTFPGQGRTGEKYIHLCKVTEVIVNKKLSHSWTYEGFEGHSVVTFELFDEGNNNTRVKLTHAGIETFPKGNADFAPESFEGGWTQLIGKNLKDFVEKK